MNICHITRRILVSSPINYSKRVDSVVRLTLLKRWSENNRPHPYSQPREELYEHVARDVAGQQSILFLGFGAWKGDSIRARLQLSGSPESEFVGFDSFAGLPKPWVLISGKTKEGAFSTEGRMPNIREQRVQLNV
jgi:hypothetical protein